MEGPTGLRKRAVFLKVPDSYYKPLFTPTPHSNHFRLLYDSSRCPFINSCYSSFLIQTTSGRSVDLKPSTPNPKSTRSLLLVFRVP